MARGAQVTKDDEDAKAAKKYIKVIELITLIKKRATYVCGIAVRPILTKASMNRTAHGIPAQDRRADKREHIAGEACKKGTYVSTVVGSIPCNADRALHNNVDGRKCDLLNSHRAALDAQPP